MKKIIINLICILFISGCSQKTTEIVGYSIAFAPSIAVSAVGLTALGVLYPPMWLLSKIDKKTSKNSKHSFCKLVDLCQSQLNLDSKTTNEILNEIKHEISYFKKREKYFSQVYNKLFDSKNEEYKKFTQEYEKNTQKYIDAYKKVLASEDDTWLAYSNETNKKILHAFYKAYERYPFINNAKTLTDNKIFAVSDIDFDYFYFDNEFLVKKEDEVLEKLSKKHIKEYKKFKEKTLEKSKKINQKEIAYNGFVIFFQIQDEKFKPILGYVSYKLVNEPDVHCTLY
ncbi:hypothetical protein [Campylobacter sp. 2457A]|nr:hypothetical protein [Campylobacter sp. 2457A]